MRRCGGGTGTEKHPALGQHATNATERRDGAHLLLRIGECFKLRLEHLRLRGAARELKLGAKPRRVRHVNRMHHQTKTILLHLRDLVTQVALRREESCNPVLCGRLIFVVD